MPRMREWWVHVELFGEFDHADLELLENLRGYVVEVITRPERDGPPTVGVLLDVAAPTKQFAVQAARQLVEWSTSAAILKANIVTRPGWKKERASATTTVRVPESLMVRR